MRSRDLLNSHRENHRDRTRKILCQEFMLMSSNITLYLLGDVTHNIQSITVVTKFITLYLKALLSLVWLFQLGPLILSTGSNYSKLKWNWDLFDGNRIGLAIIKMRFLPALIFTHRTLPKQGHTQGQQVGGERKRAPENHSS